MLIDGSRYYGTVSSITDLTIVLSRPRESLTFHRALVREVIFDQSDFLILDSGDTLNGKVLRSFETGFLVALDGGLRSVPQNHITELLYLLGPPLRIRELTTTNHGFRFHRDRSPRSFPPITLSARIGFQNLSYVFGGNLYFGSPPFRSNFSATLYLIEAGLKVNPSLEIVLGRSWCDEDTDINTSSGGVRQPKTVGYSAVHLAGLYSVVSDKSRIFTLLVRLQASFVTGYSDLESGQLLLSLTPGLDLAISDSGVQFVFQAAVHTSVLPLNRVGDSIDPTGVFLSVRARFDLSRFSTTESGD